MNFNICQISDSKIVAGCSKNGDIRIYDFKMIKNEPTDILKGHS